jgi:hypothetical protein
MCVFLTVIVILQAVDYHQGMIALLSMLFYLGLLVPLGPPHVQQGSHPTSFNAQNRLEKLFTWRPHRSILLVLLIICIIALQSLGYVNLARFFDVCATDGALAVAHLTGKWHG